MVASEPKAAPSSAKLSGEFFQEFFRSDCNWLALSCHENERPLLGLSGLLDWKLHGKISSFIKAGAITGKAGECVYIPVSQHGRNYHLLLVGAGSSQDAGKRSQPLPVTSLRKLHENLIQLKPKKLALSQSDFGNSSDEELKKSLKGVPLWILP